tara:strand:+ start:1739 stop:1903 length:165 start_codon:yes stop_codon:yes gene_type:complete
MSKKSVKLCCNSKYCPIVSVEGNTVKIVDDYGKSIRMTVAQARMINDALKELGK